MRTVFLDRDPSSNEGTFGRMKDDQGQLCVTVERPADIDHPCIPAGTYRCTKFQSPHNGKCYLLHGTEPRSMIEIHSANIMLQLLGCIAPGERIERFTGVHEGKPYSMRGVTNSKATLAMLFEELGEEFMLEIREPRMQE